MDPDPRAAPREPRLLIVSNRLPITIAMEKGVPVVRPSAGGLASGLRGPHERSGGLWIGWPGMPADGDGKPKRRAARAPGSEIARQLEERRLAPVELTAEEVAVYYGRISNAVLWPLCHDRLDQLPLRVTGWDVYERVNARFADAVAAVHQPGDLVWVHDYQLMRVPALLRERLGPSARIGYFHHIPFPNPEVFLTLPARRWLVEGLMGADVVGFHTRRYRGHFTAALRRLFNVEMAPDESVPWGGPGAPRRVRLGIHPISVDVAHFATRADTQAVSDEAARLKVDGTRLLVGIDRLDYSKGIPRRLLALERLLVEHPGWCERVRLVQVAVPSRDTVDAYKRFRREVDAMVGRINGAFGTPTWTPVHYLYRSVPESLLLALYRAADVMLVTPVRDGMNLVAKEFVASRTDDDGVLMLSEFAGAAAELGDAVQVNPYDVDGTAAALHDALIMPREERRSRMRALRAQVTAHDVHRWAEGFLRSLAAG